MFSLSFMDSLFDKLHSFNPKMKGSSFKQGSALCLLSDTPKFNPQFFPTAELMDDFLVNSILGYDSHESSQKTKVESPFIRNFGYGNLGVNNLAFSPHLLNFIQDGMRFITSSSEMIQIDSNSLLQNLGDPRLINPLKMKEGFNSKSDREISPVKESKIKMSVTMRSKTLDESSKMNDKLNAANGFTLNSELANRKTKEMNKRSKKRRRRQKKRCSTSSTANTSDEVDSCLSSSPSSSLPNSSHNKEFIVSVEHSVQVTPNIVSTFVISMAAVSDDDDSDWDACSETDVGCEPTDFEFTGLFVTNLSTPAPLLHSSNSSTADCIPIFCQDDEADEFSKIQDVLQKVNKTWNELTKEIDAQPKSPSKVSFAVDEKLVEVLPVEMYERKGEWEMYALERLRFKRRIEELEKVISPCLQTNHRLAVYRKITGSDL